MQKIVLFGAGLVAPPLIDYLLEHGFSLTIASDVPKHAAALLKGHPNGRAVPVDARSADEISALVAAHDLAVSLLPAPFHPTVGRACVAHGVPMVTSSYVSDEMLDLDAEARDKGIILLNELGSDPGIDHMSAMRVIHDVRRRGGRVVSFRSFCGGLPAPDSNDNPWDYKFSWSPRGVCTAGKSDARWIKDGREVFVPGGELFDHHQRIEVDGMGSFEGYPNRDSTRYIELYGLDHVNTMFRGTLRHDGWCDTLKSIVDLGLLSEEPITYPPDTTMSRWLHAVAGCNGSPDVRACVTDKLGIAPDSDVMNRLEWLGLFGDDPCPNAGNTTTPLDVLADRMAIKMSYEPGQRDMLVMRHEFVADFPDGTSEDITSTLVEYGEANGHSAMARTVALPAAIAARLILEGKLAETGVHIPVTADIYDPILDELEKTGIIFKEQTEYAK